MKCGKLIVVLVVLVFALPASASTLTVSLDPSNPLSNSFYTDPNSGALVSTLVFNVEALGSDAVITGLTIDPVINSATYDFAPASKVVLMKNGADYSDGNINGTNSLTFTNFNITVPQETQQSIVVQVGVPGWDTLYRGTGSTTVQLNLNSVSYTQNGSNFTTGSNILVGNTQHFFSAVPNLGLASTSVSSTVNSNGITSAVSGKFNFTVTPQAPDGGMTQPTAADFEIGFGQSVEEATQNIIPLSQITVASITPTVSGNNRLDSNQTYTIGVMANALPDQFLSSGEYQFYVFGVNTTCTNDIGTPISTDQTWGLNNFVSGPVAVTTVPEPASFAILGTLTLGALARRRR